MRRRGLQAIAALVLGVWVLAEGCAEETTGVRVANQAPEIRITAGPVADSVHTYVITFHWLATDPDGRIIDFAYAVDDTTDPTRLVETTESSVTLTFSADEPFDTVVAPGPGAPSELVRFGRHHTFFVRAVDDDGLRSPFAWASFYSVTVAPRTTVRSPVPSHTVIVINAFQVRWEVEDLDGEATGFTTRLISVPDDSLTLLGPERLDCGDCGPDWTPFTAAAVQGYTGVAVGSYLFGVRAMDDAGALEPELVFGQNALRLRVTDLRRFPFVTLSGPGQSVLLPTGSIEQRTIELISGRTATIAWVGDASSYGATVENVAYGIDLTSVDPGAPGWIETGEPFARLRFLNPEGVIESLHTLHLRIRDSAGQTVVYEARLRVAPADLDLGILYVDDAGRDATATPNDAESDAFIETVFLAEARRRGLRIDQYEVQDPRGEFDRDAPDLDILRRYRVVVWRQLGGLNVLNRAMDPERGLPLHTYMELGGSLLLMGSGALSSSVLEPLAPTFGFSPWDFGFQYLGIESEFSGSEVIAGGFFLPPGSVAGRRQHGLDAAVPTTAAAEEGWPDLVVTSGTFFGPDTGIPRVEGMTQGYDHGNRPGRLDTLYTFVSNGSQQPFPILSPLDGKPCAWRYERPERGRVLVLPFPVVWFSRGAVDSLGTRAIEWFFDE